MEQTIATDLDALNNILAEIKTFQTAVDNEIHRVSAICEELEFVQRVKVQVGKDQETRKQEKSATSAEVSIPATEVDQSISTTRCPEDAVASAITNARILRETAADQSVSRRQEKKRNMKKHVQLAKNTSNPPTTHTSTKLGCRKRIDVEQRSESISNTNSDDKRKLELEHFKKIVSKPEVGIRVYLALHGRLLSAKEVARTAISAHSFHTTFLSPEQLRYCGKLPENFKSKLADAIHELKCLNSHLSTKPKLQQQTNQLIQPTSTRTIAQVVSKASHLLQWFRSSFLSPWLRGSDVDRSSSGILRSWINDISAHTYRYFLDITSNNSRIGTKQHVANLRRIISSTQERQIALLRRQLAQVTTAQLVQTLSRLSTLLDKVAADSTIGSKSANMTEISRPLLVRFLSCLNVLHLLVNGKNHNSFTAINRLLLKQIPVNKRQ